MNREEIRTIVSKMDEKTEIMYLDEIVMKRIKRIERKQQNKD